jgi:F0F1-type ATP synthase assembly protein I
LYSFHIAAGIIGGAAVGLLIGIIASMLFGTERGATARKDL